MARDTMLDSVEKGISQDRSSRTEGKYESASKSTATEMSDGNRRDLDSAAAITFGNSFHEKN